MNEKILKRKIQREVSARKQAEELLEEKSREIYSLNNKLKKQNESLENQIQKRTLLLEKEKNKAEKASKAKGEFLAKMSHEIRTPLNGIIGLAQILEDESISFQEINEKVKMIRQSGDHLLEVINDILNYSEIEKNELNLSYSDVNIKEEVNKLKNTFYSQLKDKKLNLNISFKLNSEFIKCDIVKINQILINLINNAIKFTNKGSINIRIIQRNDQLKIIVLDTGIGIAKKNKEKLFKSFSQVNNSIKREYGGSGLGLYITESLVKLMNGYIKIKSKENIGTLFFVTVYIKESNLKQKAQQKIKLTTINKKILVVDDNKINQIVISKFLDKLNIKYKCVNNGELALREDLKLYDLIFMDIQMPVLDGISTTIKIKERDQDNHPPIIALTANSFEEDIKKYLSSGMSGYLPKPFKKEELISVLKTFLK